MLKEYFNGKELNNSLNPDEAIAYGATIEAALQMGKYSEDVSLIDVCPFSLGIAVVSKKDDTLENMKMSKIIKKGSKLPCKKKKYLILLKIIKNQFFLEYMKEKKNTLKIIIF